MDFEEIIKGIREHNELHPDHAVGCACLDIYVPKLYKMCMADQDKKTKQQMRELLRMVLRWDDMRRG